MTLVAAALSVSGSTLTAAPAEAAGSGSGSVVIYQCGTNVCRVDPDVPGSQRTVATNAEPAGVTRDGRTAGIVDRSTYVIRETALAPGGLNRTMVTGLAPDHPDFAAISDSGARVGWVWFYLGEFGGWYAAQAQRGGSVIFPASSTRQLSVGWAGDTMIHTRRGRSTYDGRICIGSDTSASCPNQFASESNRTLQMAHPDMHPTGRQAVVTRAAPSTSAGDYGLPSYGPLALYNRGARTASKVLTTGRDAYPEYSYEGDRIVFEREGQGIFVINTNGTGLRKIAHGSMPFWGGPRRAAAKPPTIGAVAKKGSKVRVRVGCPAANSRACSGTWSVRTASKYRSGRKVIKKGTLLATGRYSVGRGRSVVVTKKLTGKGRTLFRGVRKARVRVQVGSTTAVRTLRR